MTHSFLASTCQKKDWKARHKPICGKPISLETAANTAVHPPTSKKPENFWEDVDDLIGIGPAINGYERTPHLVRQISMLNKMPQAEYILFSALGVAHPILLQHNIFLMMLFREARNLAMTKGDSEAIADMCQYLVVRGPSKGNQLNRAGIVAQLSREYGVDVEHVISPLEEARQLDPNGHTSLEYRHQDFGDLLKNPERAQESAQVMQIVAGDLIAKAKDGTLLGNKNFKR